MDVGREEDLKIPVQPKKASGARFLCNGIPGQIDWDSLASSCKSDRQEDILKCL